MLYLTCLFLFVSCCCSDVNSMAPSSMLGVEDSGGDVGVQLMERAIAEIEQMRAVRKEGQQLYHSFPPACLSLLQKIDGNQRCIDCGERDPQWAAVSYGAMMCLQCSGHHRSLGVHVSLVRSVSMDEWSLEQVLNMLEGGNSQLLSFFVRHHLTVDSCPVNKTTVTKENVTRLRYKTKAASFYRTQMNIHVSKVLEAGPYRGREIARKRRYSSRGIERRNSDCV